MVEKKQTHWQGFGDIIVSLYARGMSVREIQGHLKELYHTEVSPALISAVTDEVAEEVRQWQGRPLDAVYLSGPASQRISRSSRIYRRLTPCWKNGQPNGKMNIFSKV